jgi:hypothetical protein
MHWNLLEPDRLYNDSECMIRVQNLSCAPTHHGY